jgi:aspartokinase
MSLPEQPITLSVEQIRELNHKLSDFRHDVNNQLALVAAAAELIRRRPETAAQMWETITEQPRKITEAIAQFSHELETALGIKR